MHYLEYMIDYTEAISSRRARLTQQFYDSLLSKVYDIIQDHMIRLKEPAVDKLNLSLGDKVVSFCCGTGQEFQFIEEKIGDRGFILGIDYSQGMLKKAQQRIYSKNWHNVELIQADVMNLERIIQEETYDAGICTLGLSIIHFPRKAFDNLKKFVKTGGSIVISDMQAFVGKKALLNPVLTLLNAPFGNTYESLVQSIQLTSYLHEQLQNFKKEEHLLGSYYIASGNK